MARLFLMGSRVRCRQPGSVHHMKTGIVQEHRYPCKPQRDRGAERIYFIRWDDRSNPIYKADIDLERMDT